MTRSRFDVILPTKLNVNVFDQEFEKASREIESDLKKDFEDAVKFWKKVPTFRGYVRLSGNKIYISVGTADPIFAFIDQGTVAHFIKPVNAKVLHWVDSATGEDRFSKGHWVKGIEARHITDNIESEWASGRMAEYYEGALDIAIGKSGHEIK